MCYHATRRLNPENNEYVIEEMGTVSPVVEKWFDLEIASPWYIRKRKVVIHKTFKNRLEGQKQMQINFIVVRWVKPLNGTSTDIVTFWTCGHPVPDKSSYNCGQWPSWSSTKSWKSIDHQTLMFLLNDKLAAVSQTTLWNALSLMKLF